MTKNIEIFYNISSIQHYNERTIIVLRDLR